MFALKQETGAEGWVELRVVQRLEGEDVVLVGGERARRAVSCLVVPEPGDEVVVVTAQGARFVLGIVERRSGNPLRIEAPGEMDITAGKRLGLGSGGRVEVAAGSKFVLMASGVEVMSRALRASVGVVRVGVGRLRLAAGEVLSRLKRRLTSVEELEKVEAGAIMHEASAVYSASAGTVAVEAEGDVHIDGRMVQLG